MLYRSLYKILLFWLAGLLLISCSSQSQYEAKVDDLSIHFGPVAQTRYAFDNNAQAELEYAISGKNSMTAPLDILLLFDRTGSMKKVIDSTAEAATSIVQDTQEIASNTRFAVATIADYATPDNPLAEDQVWRLETDFTDNAERISHATSAISLSNGGDIPEAYIRGLYEAVELEWRPKAKKIVIFFGDATPHILDPGRDNTLHTNDDLYIESTLNQLAQNKISVIGIYTKNSDDVVKFFTMLSNRTQGNAFSLDDAESSASVIGKAIEKELQKPPSVILRSEHQDWVSSIVNQELVKAKEHIIRFKIPQNTPAGVYQFTANFSSEDSRLNNEFSRKPMQIRLITGWINHPLLLWLPLLILIFYLIWSAISMLGGGYSQKRYVYANPYLGAYGEKFKYFALDALFYISIFSTSIAIYLHNKDLVLSQIL